MKELEEKIRKIGRSIWVFHVNTGGCNGCDFEIFDIFAPYFDVERFGIKLVPSPKHADILIVTGPVTRQSYEALKKVYEATPEPKIVIAVGTCACGGGIWYDSFATLGGVDKVIPVDVYIPGCPPKPEAIIHGILVALGKLEQKVKSEKFVEEAGEHIKIDSMKFGKLYLKLKCLIGYPAARRVIKTLIEEGIMDYDSIKERLKDLDLDDRQIKIVLDAMKELDIL